MNRLFQLLAITLFAILVSLDTEAATINLRWDRPIYRADCTPLPASEISKYEIEWEHLPSEKVGIKFPKGTLTGYELYVPLAGRYEIHIRAYDTGGLISDWDRKITVDVFADGRVSALPAPPSTNNCTVPVLPVCPYLCRSI